MKNARTRTTVLTTTIALVVLALMVIPALPQAGQLTALGKVTPVHTDVRPLITIPPYTNVSYVSSVDGFHLSYDEWLPANYTNHTKAPLVIYLHGAGNTTTWVSGGTNDWIANLNVTNDDGITERALIQNATVNGYIFIVVNTRSSAGFFANTACGGPQEQDVLDAITSEQSRRNIGALYLIGFSQGSIGSLALAANHRGMFSGVATAGTMTDVFMEYSYIMHNSTTGRLTGQAYNMVNDTCGVRPSATNHTVDAAFYYHLSPMRFYPSNYSGVRLWLAAGGDDDHAPDEVRYFSQYLELNNTVLNGTCHFVGKFGEPSGCTTTIHTEHVASPGLYQYRFFFAPNLGHTIAQLNPEAIFDFWTARPVWSLGSANGRLAGTHIIGENIRTETPSSVPTGYNYNVVLTSWAINYGPAQHDLLNFQFETGYTVLVNGTMFPYYEESYTPFGPVGTDAESCAHPIDAYGPPSWAGTFIDYAHPLSLSTWYNFSMILRDSGAFGNDTNEAYFATTYGSMGTTLSSILVNDTAWDYSNYPYSTNIDYPLYLQNGGAFVCGDAVEQTTTFTEDVFSVNGTVQQPPSIIEATMYGVTELAGPSTSVWVEGSHLWNETYTEGTVPTGLISETFNSSNGHKDIQIDNAPWNVYFYGSTSVSGNSSYMPWLNVTFGIVLVNSTGYSWNASSVWTNTTAMTATCGHVCTGTDAETGSYETVRLMVTPVRTIAGTLYLLLVSSSGVYGVLTQVGVTFVFV